MLNGQFRALLLLSLVALLACACTVTEQRLVGTWLVDVDATLALEPELEALSTTERRTRKTLLKKFLGPAVYEFTPDGRTIVTVADRRTEGTYVVRRNEGDFLLLDLRDGERMRQVRVDLIADGLIIEDNRRRIALSRR
jgi:hypothetical protein